MNDRQWSRLFSRLPHVNAITLPLGQHAHARVAFSVAYWRQTRARVTRSIPFPLHKYPESKIPLIHSSTHRRHESIMPSLLSKFITTLFNSHSKKYAWKTLNRDMVRTARMYVKRGKERWEEGEGTEAGARRGGDVSDMSFAVNHSRRLARSVAFCGERCRRDGVSLSLSPSPLLENRR